MSEEQSDAGLPSGTTGEELQTADQTTTAGSEREDSFFDPSSIQGKPELEAAYKQMQASYTKKMQGLSAKEKEYFANQQKLQMVNEFERDPHGTIQRYAQQYGIQLAGQEQQEFNPKSWDDVASHFKEQAKSEILKELQPFISEVHQVKKQSIESYMDQNFNDWRNYETEMMSLLQEHPTLANNPDKLYRLSVPDDVIQKKATQAALKRIQGQTESAQMTGNTTARKPSTIKKASSFTQAFEMAQQQLAAKGIKPPNL